ncbi:GatB/YqeY domain-containing protein [bacterium]|nr:GatB/YqeY domain-containing protein [bacterium]
MTDMSLEQTIGDDLKAAMKAGDALRRDTLRMLIAAMKNERIERGADLDEAGVMAVVRRGVKSRKDSAEQYRAADRLDLAEKEDAEIAVLEGYLPQMLDEAATAAIVEQAIADTGASEKCDIGKVMKAVMASHRDVIDGKLVNRLAAARL